MRAADANRDRSYVDIAVIHVPAVQALGYLRRVRAGIPMIPSIAHKGKQLGLVSRKRCPTRCPPFGRERLLGEFKASVGSRSRYVMNYFCS
jgi:hypothetical protein